MDVEGVRWEYTGQRKVQKDPDHTQWQDEEFSTIVTLQEQTPVAGLVEPNHTPASRHKATGSHLSLVWLRAGVAGRSFRIPCGSTDSVSRKHGFSVRLSREDQHSFASSTVPPPRPQRRIPLQSRPYLRANA